MISKDIGIMKNALLLLLFLAFASILIFKISIKNETLTFNVLITIINTAAFFKQQFYHNHEAYE
jgi:hypothetical protein